MRVQSLACQTDLFLAAFDGEIIDRGHYLVIVTPNTPTYLWGNYLLFADPPGPDDFVLWQALFAEEINRSPGLRLGRVRRPPRPQRAFTATGFRLIQYIGLVASQVQQPPHYDPGITVRPLTGDADWREVGHNHDISQTRLARLRALTEAGFGVWFGAFAEGQLAGDLGLFVKDRIGRFQEVETYPAFRRRGVCRSLVYQASHYAFEHMDAQKLVLVADEGSDAARLYQQVGFQPTER